MKFKIFSNLAVLASLLVLNFAQAAESNRAATPEITEPPFFTMTFSELANFPSSADAIAANRPDQLGFYIGRLVRDVPALTASPNKPFIFTELNSAQQFKTLLSTAASWNDFRVAVHYACQDKTLTGAARKKNFVLCTHLRNDMDDMLTLGSSDRRER